MISLRCFQLGSGNGIVPDKFSSEPPCFCTNHFIYISLGLCSIKARFKGGDTWYSGRITALNRDGSYAINYADGDVESSVHRDLIEVRIESSAP